MNEASSQASLTAARLGVAATLLLGGYLVLQPFLVGLIWGAILAYITWPLFLRARRSLGWPRTTAAVFTVAVLLVVGIPLSWFLVALAEQATELAGFLRDWVGRGAPLPTWLHEIPWIGPRIPELRASIPTAPELPGYLVRFGGQASERVVSLARGAASNVFTFAIALLALYTFYVEGEGLMEHARRLSRTLFPSIPEQFLHDVGSVVRAVVFGLIGTALVQGVLAGIGLRLFGVPSPVALGALTAVLSFVPFGPPLVWGGAAIWLFLQERLWAAVGMALWGLLLVSSVDNVLRPVLISRGGSKPIPFLIVLFGVLGGVASFGLLGLFLGPVLLSVTFTLVADFSRPEPEPPPEA